MTATSARTRSSSSANATGGDGDARAAARSVQHFRPEFLNRLDEVVIFHQLSREQIRHIVELHAGAQAPPPRARTAFVLTDEARDALADEGYDPHYGARTAQRTLQRRVQNPLAMKLLEGAFKPGTRSRWLGRAPVRVPHRKPEPRAEREAHA
jgi:ATP-dependent Clp protease ATP-binding subunit ClpA